MFYFIRNLFAILGLVAVLGAAYAWVKMEPMLSAYENFDPKAKDFYMEMMHKLAETGNLAEASIWKFKVEEDLTAQDVEDVMKFVANEHNIKNVGELPLYQQVEAMSGEDYRYVKIYMFCNAMTAARMLDYSDAFTAYLPCRVSLVEDKTGQLWVTTLNMDGMIYGGKPLPPDLKEEAIGVKETILDIMKRGASGAF